MLPFRVTLQPGRPVYGQIIEAVKYSAAAGTLRSGERFPSVRAIAQELGVNPNTVQRAIAELTTLGLLEVRAGQGCFITSAQPARRDERAAALRPLLRQALVEAATLGMDFDELLALLQRENSKLHEQRD